MPAPLPPPGWLQTFEAAARHSGFAAAAEELGLTPAAVSQQIRALEGRLGFALFRRLPRGVELTEMGRAYLPTVQRAFADLSAATAGLFGLDRPRLLTVRAPLSFAAIRLAPVLGEFRALHPGIPLRLFTSVWGDKLGEEAVDLDIRYGDGRWPAQEVVALAPPVSVPVCPPGTDLGPDPRTGFARLAAARAIHVMGCEGFWEGLFVGAGLPGRPAPPDLVADASLVALEMAEAGLGPALIARDLAEPYAAAGRVLIPPGLAYDTGQAHHAVLPAGRGALRPEVLLFRNWLVDRLAVT